MSASLYASICDGIFQGALGRVLGRRVEMNGRFRQRADVSSSYSSWTSLRVLMAPAAPAILYGPVSGQVLARLFSIDVQDGTMWWALGLSVAMICLVLACGMRQVLYLRRWDPMVVQYEGGSGRKAEGFDPGNNYGLDDVYPTLCLGPALLLSHRSLGIPLDAVVLGMLPVIGITGCFARSASECACGGGCGGHCAVASFILDVLGCLQAVAVAVLMPGFFFFSRWDRPQARWCADDGRVSTTDGTTVTELAWSVAWLGCYLLVAGRFVLDRGLDRGIGAGPQRDAHRMQWWAVAALVRLAVVVAAMMLGEHIVMSIGVSSILFSSFCGCAVAAGWDGAAQGGDGEEDTKPDDGDEGNNNGGGDGEESLVPERILVASMVGLLGLVFAGSVAVGEDELVGCRTHGAHQGVVREAGLYPVMLGAYVLLFEALRGASL